MIHNDLRTDGCISYCLKSVMSWKYVNKLLYHNSIQLYNMFTSELVCNEKIAKPLKWQQVYAYLGLLN